ncbi:MAG: hypothetical protein FWC46_05570 [Actinomycetia bacterium]|nr:hypothetical protein [Actinomycetes bacterium]
MGLIGRLRTAYRDQLGPREMSYADGPEEAWAFTLAGPHPPTVTITHGGPVHGYSIDIDILNELIVLDDKADDPLTDFVEACAQGGLVMVKWSAGIWQEWCLMNRDGVDVSRSRHERGSRIVAGWRRFLASRPDYREQRIPLENPPADAAEDAPDAYARRVTAPFVARLGDLAAQRGLDLEFAWSTRRYRGEDGIPQLDVSAGGNLVTTFWPETRTRTPVPFQADKARRRAAWLQAEPAPWIILRAGIVPAALSRRVDTCDTEVFTDSVGLAQIVALLAGDVRVTRDNLVVGQGRDKLALRIWTEPVAIDEYGPWLADQWASRVNAAAARQNTSVTCTVGLGDAFGDADVPQLDVTANGNTVTLWPEDARQADMLADIGVPSAHVRVRTERWWEAWPVTDADLDRLIQIVEGQGRLVRERRKDGLVVGEGRDRFWLTVEEKTVLPAASGDDSR